jgi:acetoacetate decarboxylase
MKFVKLKYFTVALVICCGVQGQPYQYNGSEFISITFQTSQDVINRLVPEPLIANSDGRIILDIGLQKMEIGLHYHEMILSIPCEFDGKMGSFTPLLYLNNADAISGGREIWGFPKYFADISFQKDGRNVTAKISRYDDLLIEADLEIGDTINNYEASDPLAFVLKYIPSVEEGSIDVKQLNSVYSRNFTFTKLQEAEAELTINSIPNASIGEIPIIKILNAYYYESNFVLGFGKIEFDYLKQQ